MKTCLTVALLVMFTGLSGCAAHVSKSKRQQVELATQTGPYAYLRSVGPGPGAR